MQITTIGRITKITNDPSKPLGRGKNRIGVLLEKKDITPNEAAATIMAFLEAVGRAGTSLDETVSLVRTGLAINWPGMEGRN